MLLWEYQYDLIRAIFVRIRSCDYNIVYRPTQISGLSVLRKYKISSCRDTLYSLMVMNEWKGLTRYLRLNCLITWFSFIQESVSTSRPDNPSDTDILRFETSVSSNTFRISKSPDKNCRISIKNFTSLASLVKGSFITFGNTECLPSRHVLKVFSFARLDRKISH